MDLPREFHRPPGDCSPCPVWYWTADPDADSMRQRMDAWHDRGVMGFMLHPGRRSDASPGFMSDAWIERLHEAVEHAAARGMWVVLHDGGMHDEATGGGLVTQNTPDFARRVLRRHVIPAEQRFEPTEEAQVMADLPINGNRRCLIVCQPVDALGDETSSAVDPLQPEPVAAFLRAVYDRYHAMLGEFFGSTVRAIYADPPLPPAADLPDDARPGTTDILEHVNAYLGYDFTPYLPRLWDDDAGALRFRADYERAIKHRLTETYYQSLREWCERHGLALTGSTPEPDDLALQRCFHWPGQRTPVHMNQPGEGAIVGPPSTSAKVAASVKAHHRLERAGQVYPDGDAPDLSAGLIRWFTHWLAVRGCDLLMPHAPPVPGNAPGSIHGKTPDIADASNESEATDTPDAPSEPTWQTDTDASRRLCWLNREGTPVVKTAVLALSDYAPSRAARVLYENQIDFHYLEAADLATDAIIANDGLDMGGCWYRAVILDGIALPRMAREPLARLAGFGRVLAWRPPEGMPLPPNAIVCHEPEELTAALREKDCGDVRADPTPPGLRIRHLTFSRENRTEHWFMLFNEQSDPVDTLLDLPVSGRRFAVDPHTAAQQPLGEQVRCLLPAYKFGLLRVISE